MTAGHYTHEEWAQYRTNSLPGSTRRKMEEHLSACDRCLETYLSCIGEEEAELAEVFLPQGFSKQVSRMVADRMPGPSPSHLVALRNYAIAAVVTAVLLAGGWFSAMPRAVTSVFFDSGQPQAVLEEHLPPWSVNLANRINEWVEKAIEGAGLGRPSRPF